MKKAFGIILVIAALCISGCATAEGKKDYTALAKEKGFDSFFPSPSSTFYFADLDEAYDFVNTAQAKFAISSGKSKAKGLAAKLIGPPVIKGKPVTVTYFMQAFTQSGSIDLDKRSDPLEKAIRNALSATLVVMVFYQDRGVSLSNFHLASGWRYDNNSQFQYFNYNDARYDADYPRGWGTDKAFSYLRKEDTSSVSQTPSRTQARYIVNADALNVRSGPSADTALVGQLKRNDRVEIIDRSGQWWKIKSGSIEGYVNSSFLAEEN